MPTSYNRIELGRQKRVRPISIDTNQQSAENGAGAKTYFYALDPGFSTSIIVTHNAGDTPLVAVTNTLTTTDDLEDASVLFAQVYDGTSTPYLAGDSRGLTGVRITVTPTSGDVDISIMQYRPVI